MWVDRARAAASRFNTTNKHQASQAAVLRSLRAAPLYSARIRSLNPPAHQRYGPTCTRSGSNAFEFVAYLDGPLRRRLTLRAPRLPPRGRPDSKGSYGSIGLLACPPSLR